MPYLRAALNPKRQPAKPKFEREDGSLKLSDVRNINLTLALRQWIQEDDKKSTEELIRMGLA